MRDIGSREGMIHSVTISASRGKFRRNSTMTFLPGGPGDYRIYT
jgi:hypothetical protein